ESGGTRLQGSREVQVRTTHVPRAPLLSCSLPVQCFVAARIAAHTFCGVAGICRSLLPMASVIALMTAGGEPMAPASPQPLLPSGLPGHGVFWCETWNDGRSSARGMV